ncbi:Haa1p [Saccharomyces cerevisiae x Saccharomyces kudriavzevii VIN7]|uniref:Haa1p n=1 Tax=Saccharomyces cerevisiae x Saccharomyces kudriavzevii (strain VIN7) TaxID=1095631 RepID=H0H2A2_SACCK|nr:Haa1p [Saccharomyces cerevisiae x Saccharomyces kudriavzevii VIN7]
MVLINGIKYACERCIRGHRVTTCNHTDQPLMMIKPKGRPSTTCDYCKQLRKNKNANPEGVCSCGRLEKKKVAQKAKEEARAKAKEKQRKQCTCGMEEICKYHAQKRHLRKSPSNSQKKGRSISRSQPMFERVLSSTSLDSNILSGHGGLSDTSSILTSTFLDSEPGAGKISKDYHHVPSLASISSLQSSQSLDQNFSIPQSPPLSSMSFNFLTGNVTDPNQGHNNHQHSKSNNNWQDSSVSLPAKSDSRFTSMDKNNSINLDLLGHSKRISIIANPRVGEVSVPLEEYIPSDIDGVGKVTDKSSAIYDWPFDESIERNFSTTATAATDSSKLDINDNNNSNNIINANDNNYSNTNNSDNSINNNNNNNNDSNNNSNNNNNNTNHSNSNNYNYDNNRNCDNGTINNNPSRQEHQGNGLFDMFTDSSSISTLSRANLLLQEKIGSQENSSKQEHYSKNPQFRHQLTARSRSFIHHPANEYLRNTFGTSSNNDIGKGVEVLSLTPSFMDIPEKERETERSPSSNYITDRPFTRKPRSSSIDVNHRYPPMSSANIAASPSALNNTVASNLDDQLSLTSLNSQPSSIANMMMDSSNMAEQSSIHSVPQSINSPRMSKTGNRQDKNVQAKKEERNALNSVQDFSQLENTPGDVNQMFSPPLKTVNRPDAMRENSPSSNFIFQGNGIISTPSARNELPDTSPMSSIQTASPPSQLLTDQGFADLDNFMSSL